MTDAGVGPRIHAVPMSGFESIRRPIHQEHPASAPELTDSRLTAR